MKIKLWLFITCLYSILFFQVKAEADLKLESYKNGQNIRKVMDQVLVDAESYTVKIMSKKSQVACGTIVDSNGLILSKASELNGELTCVLHDGSIRKIEVLAEDSEYDLALLGIHIKNLPVVNWSEKPAQVGQLVGSHSGEEIPTSLGIISTPSRSIPRQNVTLGISLIEEEGKIKLSRIFANSAASRFGLHKGDELVGIGQKKVSRYDDIKQIINSLHPGELITLKVVREEKTLDVKMRLGDDTSKLSREFMTSLLLGNVSQRRGGFPTVIQHDSPLQVRHSGSPLIGLDGKAIGINIARADRVESFAVPAVEVKRVYQKLKSTITWPQIVAPAVMPITQPELLVN